MKFTKKNLNIINIDEKICENFKCYKNILKTNDL